MLQIREYRISFLKKHSCDLSLETAARYTLVGLAEVEAGTVHTDILTPWTSEERILHDYFREGPGAYSLRVRTFWQLDNPLQIYSCKRQTDTQLDRFFAKVVGCLSDRRLVQIAIVIGGSTFGVVLCIVSG